jgi:Zn-dependent protease
VILRYLSVLGDAPEVFVILIGAFAFSMLVGLTFHEFSHAFVADSLGDHTPRRLGRVSLDPRRHLDPVGSTLIFFVGFGWAKPVPINPSLTDKPSQALAMISAAGPVSNLILAGVAAIPIRLGWVEFWHPFVPASQAQLYAEVWTQTPQDLIGLFLGTIVLLNLLLATFNLLPIAPLDGFNAAVGLLPPDLSRQFAQTAAWGPGILILLIIVPRFANLRFDPLFSVISPIVNFFLFLFVGDATSLRLG